MPHGDLGANGDLNRWKLIPAIGNLAAANRLPSRFVIVGFAFDPLTAESFRQQLNDEIKIFSTSPIDPEFLPVPARAPFQARKYATVVAGGAAFLRQRARRSKPGNGLYWG